jgi:hypothetical protein
MCNGDIQYEGFVTSGIPEIFDFESPSGPDVKGKICPLHSSGPG